MIRYTLKAASGLLLLVALLAPAHAEIASKEVALGEMALGEKDAPVVIYAFESLTCPHCRAFHQKAYAQIKEKYVDAGKVRIVFKDFPLNAQAFFGTLVARCLGPDRYVGMIEMLFENQSQWGSKGGDEFFQSLGQYARLAGMTDEEFKSCVNNQELIKGVQAMQKEISDKYNVQSTPTFLIGTTKTVDTDDAQRIEGAQPFPAFEKAIEAALKSAGTSE